MMSAHDPHGPAVAIVIVNWNGWQDTQACLETLGRCTYPNKRIYVVDNGSVDESMERLTHLRDRGADFRLIATGANLGFSGGNNVGIAQALSEGADYVLLLNNDTVVESGFLEPLVEAMEARPDVGIVTSKIYFAWPSKKIWFFGGHMDRNRGIGGPIGGQQEDSGQYPDTVECDYASGCVLMASADLIRKVGMLDEAYFYLCEDADFCFRVADAGYKILAIGSSIVWHKVSASVQGGEESPTRLYFRARNQLLLIAKNRKEYRLFQDGLWMVYFQTRYLLKRVAKGFSMRGTVYYARGLADYFRGCVGNMPQRSVRHSSAGRGK